MVKRLHAMSHAPRPAGGSSDVGVRFDRSGDRWVAVVEVDGVQHTGTGRSRLDALLDALVALDAAAAPHAESADDGTPDGLA
jgi:hypothetical protein